MAALLDRIPLTSLVFQYKQNNGVTSHPSNSEGWKEYESLKKLPEEKYRNNYKFYLLCPILFLDEYQENTTRKKGVYGLYLVLGNLPKELMFDQRYKILIATIPADANAQHIIKAIVPAMKKLQQGLVFVLYNIGVRIYVW